jgi:hypothetical protein
MEFLRRAVSWLDMNSEDLLSDLPTPEACLDFFRLISEDYDVSTFEEIMCCIEEGLATPDKLGEFVVKWGLDKKWKFDIDTRQHRMVAKAIRLHKAMAARKAEGK